MKMKEIFLACLAVGLVFNAGIAQEEDDLVVNGSFEDTEGRIKKAGSLYIATGWVSPTKTGADLYSDKITAKFGIPENFNGREDAYDGSYYAGFSAFSYGNKEPRTYVSSKLKLPMRKGQKYCVKFYVSLAESSKYACNNIAANFSKKQYNIEADKNIIGESHVTHINNPVFEALFGWTEVCGTYISTGGEKFVTIGNFSTNGSTESTRIKKPTSFRGQQGIRAYYYVDNLSVVLIDDESECECQTDVEEQPSFVYEVSPVNADGSPAEQVIKYSVVYFGYNKSAISVNGEEHLNNVITVLKAKPNNKIVLNIHTDEDEASDADAKEIEAKRGEAIKKYMASKGIAPTRVVIETNGSTSPADKNGTEIAKAKNRRVTFTLR